jgi:hypothetical protein
MAEKAEKTEIIVKKPGESEIAAMKSKPTWECGVSRFNWFYDSEETCLLTAGEVTVEYGDGKSVNIKAGDLATFPQGLACVWDVKKPIRKHYVFK